MGTKKSKDVREVTLPSGKVAQIRKGNGRDLKAARSAAKARDGWTEDDVNWAVIAQLTQIDGNPIVMEDLGEMELMDVIALEIAVLGNDSSSAEKTSSPSSTEASPTTS